MFNLTGILFLISKHSLKTDRMTVELYFRFATPTSRCLDKISSVHSIKVLQWCLHPAARGLRGAGCRSGGALGCRPAGNSSERQFPPQ